MLNNHCLSLEIEVSKDEQQPRHFKKEERLLKTDGRISKSWKEKKSLGNQSEGKRSEYISGV